MARKLDIKKKYYKKSFLVHKGKLQQALDRKDVTVYLDEEIHYDNGQSEMVYRMYIEDNFS